jgi:methylated-DNA-[protein]-cysteine S-methyltransferase
LLALVETGAKTYGVGMPWMLFDTSIGPCGFAWNDVGITQVQLPEATREATQQRLVSRAGSEAATRATPRTTPAWVMEAIALAKAHLDGKPQDFARVPIDLSGLPPFTAKLYRALQQVPAGKTVAYGELARSVGSPGSARAVGRAMATNPVPLLVPCQRVVGQAGKMVGFSAYGGVVTKERMLAIEHATATPNQTPLFAPPSSGAASFPYDPVAARKHLEGADKVLAAHLATIGDFGLSLKQTEGTFAALAEAIVYQQLNGKAAATIFGRVRAVFPKGRLDPRLVLLTEDNVLRGAGLSKNKLLALRDLAERTVNGTVPTLAQLERMEDEAIVDTLTEVRGVGRWTVEMLLIFRLGRPDVLPVADYGIKKGFARVFHAGKRKEELPTDADLVKRGERWRPFRSVASWYLWRAADAG